MKKTMTIAQPAQAVITSITPRIINLQQGGPAAMATVEGQNLEILLSMQAVRGGQAVDKIRVKLVQPWPASKRIELQAAVKTPLVQGCQLRAKGRAGLNEFRLDIPVVVFCLNVVDPQFPQGPAAATVIPGRNTSAIPAGSRNWIREQAKFLARTPGAEDSPAFLAALRQQAAQFPENDIMALLMAVLKESLEQANEDKAYFLGRLDEFNHILQELRDFIKYLRESLVKLEGKAAGDAVCDAGRPEVQAGIRKLRSLQSRTPPGPLSQVQEPRTIGELRSLIQSAIMDLEMRSAELKKSIEMTATRLEMAKARYGELFPKMMEAMRKLPSNLNL